MGFDESGDRGGLAKLESGPRDAEGLKEKFGSGGGIERLFSAAARPDVCGFSKGKSTADIGRRPVALENEAGAEDGMGRAGKTKGGFGSGPGMLMRAE